MYKSAVARTSLTLLAHLCFGAIAHAQLFVGTDDLTLATQVADVSNLNNVSYMPSFAGVEVWGATYDPPANQLWISDGADLYRSPVSGPPIRVATITVDGQGASMTGLGWANGSLYGFRSVGTIGIYNINTVTGASVLSLATPNFDFGGLDFNAANGLFYAANDQASTATPGPGLYSIDVLGAGLISKVANYPAGQSDIDGLAVGGGKAFLVTDQPGSFYAYELSQGNNGTYQPFTNPWASSEVFSGAAYVPEPASICLLSVAALAAFRRRSR